MVKRMTRSQVLAQGRDAVLAHRLKGGPAPQNPYGSGTTKALYFRWGTERASRLVDQIMDIGR